jgi:hypothetical protein
MLRCGFVEDTRGVLVSFEARQETRRQRSGELFRLVQRCPGGRLLGVVASARLRPLPVAATEQDGVHQQRVQLEESHPLLPARR